MYIYSASIYANAPADAGALKEELKRHTDFYFRRVSKFVLLALIGAHACAACRPLKKDTGVYLTTENGNLADTDAVLGQIYRQQSLPLPFNFINTMTNTASFYVAQGLDLYGRNISVSSQNLSFERGLELVQADMDTGAVGQALIGGVDEATAAQSHFEASSGPLPGRINEIDRSCWLCVGMERNGAIGEVTGIRSCRTLKEALDLFAVAAPPAPMETVLAFGFAVAPAEKELWKARFPQSREFDYVGRHGGFNVTTACGVASFLNTFRGVHLVHINRNFNDQYVILEISRYKRP